MNVSIAQLKLIINQFENTVFPEELTKVRIPVLLEDFNWLKYDNETVQTQNIHFEKINGLWHVDLR